LAIFSFKGSLLVPAKFFTLAFPLASFGFEAAFSAGGSHHSSCFPYLPFGLRSFLDFVIDVNVTEHCCLGVISPISYCRKKSIPAAFGLDLRR
jgi:hypothetical protein